MSPFSPSPSIAALTSKRLFRDTFGLSFVHLISSYQRWAGARNVRANGLSGEARERDVSAGCSICGCGGMVWWRNKKGSVHAPGRVGALFWGSTSYFSSARCEIRQEQ